MSLQSIGKKVVDMCNAGKNFDVMHTLYDPNIASVEPTGKATVGKEPVIKKSEIWATTVEIHGEKVVGPFFHGPDKFATKTIFDITRKATGQRVQLEEITVYTVKNDLITREEFFFGGDQW
ncbi:MAG: nuclear transport factor 2 family protein [Planctomycetes bacterium]|nr:nuclear transport factor 2 family protein [Planctomycetota bacterium]